MPWSRSGSTPTDTANYLACRSPRPRTARAGGGFFRDLFARGLSGVLLVTSDAHRGLVEATGATLPGASRQRRHTHYAANLMSVTPKASWPWVKTLLHSVYDQPDATAVHAQFDRVLDALGEKFPKVAAHLDAARPDVLAFTVSRASSGARPGRCWAGPVIPAGARPMCPSNSSVVLRPQDGSR